MAEGPIMPKMFRVMHADPANSNRPKVAHKRFCLGLRSPGFDGDPDGRNHVCPAPPNEPDKAIGLSVNPSIRAMRYTHVPAHFGHLVTGAEGPEGTEIWAMGDGEFARGPVAPALQLCLDGTTHGIVEADADMHVDSLKQALLNTVAAWRKIDVGSPDAK